MVTKVEIKESSLKALTYRFMFVKFIYELSRTFFHGIYALFLLNKGMGVEQIANVKIFFLVTIVFAEVPCGVLADRFGRRRTFMLSCLTCSLAFFRYYTGTKFWEFALAEALYGLGLALESGIIDSYIMDIVANSKCKFRADDVFAKINISGITGMLIAGNLGIFISKFDVGYPWLMSCVGMGVAFFIAGFLLKKIERLSLVHCREKARIKEIVQFGAKHLMQNHELKIILLILMVYAGFSQSIFQYWQLIFKNRVEFEFRYLPLLYTMMHLMNIMGSKFVAFSYLRKCGLAKALFIAMLTLALPIFIMREHYSIFVLMLLLSGSQWGRGMFDPMIKMAISKVTISKNRVTVLSFMAGIIRLSSVFALWLIGKIVLAYGVMLCWKIMVATFLGISIICIVYSRDKSWLYKEKCLSHRGT